MQRKEKGYKHSELQNYWIGLVFTNKMKWNM